MSHCWERLKSTVRFVLITVVSLTPTVAGAQSEEKDPAAVIELGGATAWNIKDGGASSGPSMAIEVTPIENWLELEGGVTALFSSKSTEWDTDLLFKKP